MHAAITLVLGATLTLLPFSAAADVHRSLQALGQNPEYVDVGGFAGVRVDLRYASPDNFAGRDLYGPLRTAFLHREAATKLRRAAELLQKEKPGYSLLVLDALRPRSVQKLLWQHVRGTAQQAYVADPQKGSMHNFGLAVDLTVCDEQGRELDMGTPFDAFSPLSQPRLEKAHLREGRLTPQQLDNRRLLRGVMERAGFIQLPLEWWHFDAIPVREVRRQHTIVE